MWRLLAELAVPSEPGNERWVMREVAAAVSDVGLSQRQLERLRTAVAEATMNAMEHGNRYQAELPVRVRVLASSETLAVQITDLGSGPITLDRDPPDLQAKLASHESPRGWGLFLIKHMVDDLRITHDRGHFTVELVLRLDGQPPGGP